MTETRKRILHIITSLNTGGAEMMLFKLLTATDRVRFESCVVCLGDLGTIGPRIQALGVPVITIGMRRTVISLSLFRLLHAVRDFRPDVIQGWMYHGNIAALVARMVWPAPVYWNIRHSFSGYRVEKKLTALMILIGAWFSRFSSVIIYNSETSRRQHEAQGYCASRGMFLPNGFPMHEFVLKGAGRSALPGIQADSNCFWIGIIGRDHPMKDHANFIAAAGIFAIRCPQARFVMIGRGLVSENARLAGLVKKWDLEGRILLLGERNDVSNLLHAMDIFCLSSSFGEAFPNVVGEAMACGVPCVVTDVGDTAAIVEDTGIVVPASNPEALANAFCSLWEAGANVRHNMGVRARERVALQYSLDRIVSKYMDLYARSEDMKH